jgi:hypothetical protein
MAAQALGSTCLLLLSVELLIHVSDVFQVVTMRESLSLLNDSVHFWYSTGNYLVDVLIPLRIVQIESNHFSVKKILFVTMLLTMYSESAVYVRKMGKS